MKRRRKRDLAAELEAAKLQQQEVRRRGRRREPMLRRLEKAAVDNHVVDRVLDLLDSTRKGHP